MSLFNELKRRNVIRVAVAYVVLGWVLLQVADIIIPAAGLPEWSMRLILVLLALGFPVALIFSWAFELTPEGLKKEKDVDRSRSVTSVTAKKLDIAVIVMLVVAVSLTVYLQTRSLSPPAEQVAAVELPAEPVLAQNSIAVLPFTNMSSDEENEFFADGLSEELLNVLAKMSELKVAGRTSSFHFKGKNEDLRKIGEMLGVEHILEGSVRKSGKQVRITAQLVKADDGFHLWSDTYDRELNDIFAIQDEIASNVASALRVTLLGETESVTKNANNIDPEVYARFIAAKARIATREAEILVAAHHELEKIVDDAPDYAEAWAALSIVAMLRWRNDGTLTADEAIDISTRAMERAESLAPENDYVLIAKGNYLGGVFGLVEGVTLEQSEAAYRQAIAINPENVEGIYWLAINLLQRSRFDEASELIDQALRIDPLARVARGHRINLYGIRGEFDQGVEFVKQSNRLIPEFWVFYIWAALNESRRGRPDRAWLWANLAEQSGVEPHLTIIQTKGLNAFELDDIESMKQALDEMVAFDPKQDILRELTLLVIEGRYDEAIAEVERGIARDGFGDWNGSQTALGSLSGRCELVLDQPGVSEIVDAYRPEDVEPDTHPEQLPIALNVSHCLLKQNDKEVAEKILRESLNFLQPRSGRFDRAGLRIQRVIVHALLGETDIALQEFRDYYQAGFGVTFWGALLVSFDRDPLLENLHDEPEFKEIMAAIRARNAERLAALKSGELTVDTPL